MAVSPLRAVLAAQLQATWNRTQREMGRQGAWALGLALLFLSIFVALPLLLGSGIGGFALGRNLAAPAVPLVYGVIHTLLVVLGGVLGGLLGRSQGVAQEGLRLFPIRLRTLFAANLAAGLGGLLPAVFTVILAGLHLGASLARPLAAPLFLFLFLAQVLALLLVQALVGSLAEALARRLKLMLFLLGFLLWLGSLLPSFAPQTARPRGLETKLQALAEPLRALAEALPATQAVQGVASLMTGNAAGLLRLAGPLLLLVLLALLSLQRIRREAQAPEAAAPASNRDRRLWSFQTPVAGLARLHWQSLVGSPLGRFAFLVPVIAVVLVKGPLGRIPNPHLWALPAAVYYLNLTALQLQYNQFGLEGGGIKALLLLPLDGAALLEGRTRALLVHHGLQLLLLTGLMALVLPLRPGPVVASLAFGFLLFLGNMALGHLLSVRYPRPIARKGLKNSALPMVSTLSSMGFGMASAGLLGGLYAFLVWAAPALLAPVFLALALLAAWTYRRWILPAAGRFLDAHREDLMQALG